MPKRRPKPRQRRRKSVRRLGRRLLRVPNLFAAAVLGAVLAFAVLLIVGLATQDGGGPDRLDEIVSAGRTRGSATAPVTIVEFADYQCVFCKRFFETTAARIEEEYVATDKVRFEYRNFAQIGPESMRAAEAAECAAAQGKFWEYHDYLFEKQRAENSGTFSDDRLKRFAGELGLDQAEFDSCFDSGTYEQLVLDETDAGRDAGIESTPSFLINGERLDGAKPFEEFRQMIEEALAEAATTP